MKALITGASNGIGKEMAIYLSELGYDLYLVARSKNKLEELKRELKTEVNVYEYDLSIIDNCYKLYELLKDEKIDIVINNAGFGVFCNYSDDTLDKEINMIDLNVKCLHILTKLFVNNKHTKRILNVSSSAGLMKGGPLMSGYYGTKSYVCSYSFALYEELRRNKSDKKISVLCPGPVDTGFNKRANVRFNLKSLDARYVARYAIDKMFKNKLIIIPGFAVRMGIFFSRFLPTKILLRISYNIQKKKDKKKK
ncbi:MAG: SDR family NAD(P)-dependent oxidoreductase [Bacilli bacterium]|nr:SDR family NAD(P)-dependent oxidoreductase [Bacilli bacterium]